MPRSSKCESTCYQCVSYPVTNPFKFMILPETEIAHTKNGPVPVRGADRGERAEVDAILEEAGFADYINNQIEQGVNDRCLFMLRAMLMDVIWPPKGSSSKLQALVMAYALDMPGLVSMRKAAIEYNLGKLGRSAVSKRVKLLARKYDLPPSSYMKSDAACDKYSKTNQPRRPSK